jgi:uncharacterized repeat protein (TIGR04052 family)
MRRITEALILFALAGCGSGDATYTIKFAASVAGAPFSCSSSYNNIGTTKTTIQPLDFRFYVHDVMLVRAGGQMVPLKLKQDMKWQSDRVALVDMEDGTGNCMTESGGPNTFVVGTAPSNSDYTGLQFGLGIPPDIDHLQVSVAAAPENVPAMWWSWLGGYRFLRIDVQSLKNQSWNFHVGATECTQASMSTSITCKFDNQATITLQNFKPDTSTVTMDLATLYADSDLDHQVDGIVDQVPGCMSGDGDPECPMLYNKVGLSFDSAMPAPAQTFFTVSP